MKRQKGFTLVELLIVIALLGALAIGLIGALDPFEQLKKGTDTGTRDLVNQVQTAVLRYYATTNRFPWESTPALSGGFTAQGLNVADFDDSVSNMIVAGELKSNFREIYGSKLSQIIVTYTPSGIAQSATVVACYQPQSKSFLVDPNTKYSNDGTTTDAVNCKALGGANNCFWCVQ
jgi:prepilin-type N-terminal cleavage/methylation domain-containing protein